MSCPACGGEAARQWPHLCVDCAIESEWLAEQRLRPLLKGGQGRTAASVRADSAAVTFCLLGLVLVLLGTVLLYL